MSDAMPFLLPVCGEKVPKADEGPAERRRAQRMLDATKSQFTRFQNASTYFGRALR